MAIDVVIVTHNNEATLARALASVVDSPQVVRVVVVDNASRDGTLDVARSSPALVVSNPENLGFAAAVNQALPQGDSEFVLLLNPDAELVAGALEALALALRDDDEAVVAAPNFLDESAVRCGARRFATLANRLVPHVPLLTKLTRWYGAEYASPSMLDTGLPPCRVDYVWGACLLVRRSFLEQTRGLDERFFLYSEDEDLCRQAAQLGLRVLLVREALVRHKGAHSSGGNRATIMARQFLALEQLFDKWQGPAAATVFRYGIRAAMWSQVVNAWMRAKHDQLELSRAVLARLHSPERFNLRPSR
jgi:GT2 family glycosyltransferase